MEISFEGIGQVAATFAAETGVNPGMAVTISGDSTVGLGDEGDIPCGVVLAVKNGMAAVQISGMARVGYSGAAPAVGWSMVAGDGTGKIKSVSADGINCLIAAVDTAGSTAVIKL